MTDKEARKEIKKIGINPYYTWQQKGDEILSVLSNLYGYDNKNHTTGNNIDEVSKYMKTFMLEYVGLNEHPKLDGVEYPAVSGKTPI